MNLIELFDLFFVVASLRYPRNDPSGSYTLNVSHLLLSNTCRLVEHLLPSGLVQANFICLFLIAIFLIAVLDLTHRLHTCLGKARFLVNADLPVNSHVSVVSVWSGYSFLPCDAPHRNLPM